MIVIGLTGSVGTGKSTVAKFFKELGAYLIDWDVIARDVVHPHLQAWEGIVAYFGRDVLNEDLTLNRQKLADIVFEDKGKVAKLNQIVHPEIFIEDQRITKEIENLDPDALVVKDIPLLTEASRGKSFDKIIVVYASEETQLKRLEERGMSREDAKNRIQSQDPLDEKIKFADFIIDNDGSLEQTKRQVKKIYTLLKKGEEDGRER